MKTIVLLLFVAFSSTLLAQSEKSLLWEVSGNGLKQPSYVFGTIHMIPKKDYYLTKEMKQSLKACNTLVVEVDMFSMSLKEQINIAQQSFLPNGKTLKHHMDSVDYLSFKQMAIDSLGIKESKLENQYIRIKPFFLTGILLKEYVGKIKTYEKELHKAAKKNKMGIAALETIEFQMGLANSLPMEQQLDGIDDMKGFYQYFEMVELYKNQDIDGLLTLSLEEYETPEELKFMQEFIYDRNADWIPKIENMAKEKSCFIAVGALHLPGEKGVLELLKNAGYTVKPVK